MFGCLLYYFHNILVIIFSRRIISYTEKVVSMLSFHCESLIHSFIQQIFPECLLMPDPGVGAIKTTKSKTSHGVYILGEEVVE